MDTSSGAYELNHKCAMKHLERVLKFVRTPHIFAVSWSCYIPHISSYYLLSRIRSGCLTVCDVYVFPVSKEGRFRLAVKTTFGTMKTGLIIELVLILRLYKEQTCQNGLKFIYFLPAEF